MTTLDDFIRSLLNYVLDEKKPFQQFAPFCEKCGAKMKYRTTYHRGYFKIAAWDCPSCGYDEYRTFKVFEGKK